MSSKYMRIAGSLKRSKQYTNKRQDIEMITKTTKESKRSIIMKSARNSANDDGACRLLYVCVSVWKCSGYFYCLQTIQLFVYTLIVSRIMVHRSCEMHWYNQNAPNMCVLRMYECKQCISIVGIRIGHRWQLNSKIIISCTRYWKTENTKHW